jgi:hypothetical protein
MDNQERTIILTEEFNTLRNKLEGSIKDLHYAFKTDLAGLERQFMFEIERDVGKIDLKIFPLQQKIDKLEEQVKSLTSKFKFVGCAFLLLLALKIIELLIK